MRFCGWALAAVLFLSGCASVLPSSAQYPSPVSSAAQPGASNQGGTSYARKGAEALRLALKSVGADEALERIPAEGLKATDEGVEAGCVAAPGSKPVLVCHFGPSAKQPVAQVILWYDREGWQSQLYPQASIKMADERKAAMEAWGCQLGCYSGISAARQAGTELLVVVNHGYATGNQKAEEAQLLHLVEDRWQVVWVPGEGDWNYGDAEVILPAKGIASLQVKNSSRLRQDRLAGFVNEQPGGQYRRFTERWERKGDVYVMRDQVEQPSPYGALVRLISYLSAGADEKATALLSPAVPLETARKALAQKPQRQGWEIVQWGPNGFLLDTTKTGKPGIGVRFEQTGSDWVLAEVWEVKQ